jgi:hypothetical protein
MRYFFLFLLIPTLAFAKTYQTKPYSKSSGALVQPHLKTSPDNTRMNNRSYKPSTRSSYKR